MITDKSIDIPVIIQICQCNPTVAVSKPLFTIGKMPCAILNLIGKTDLTTFRIFKQLVAGSIIAITIIKPNLIGFFLITINPKGLEVTVIIYFA